MEEVQKYEETETQELIDVSDDPLLKDILVKAINEALASIKKYDRLLCKSSKYIVSFLYHDQTHFSTRAHISAFLYQDNIFIEAFWVKSHNGLKICPDYCSFIKQPMCVDMIEERKHSYKSLREFRNDVSRFTLLLPMTAIAHTKQVIL